MKKLKRFIYLGYYVKKLDWPKFFKFLNYTAQTTGKSKFSILLDVLASVFKYNISLLEYFQFRFFEKDKYERAQWAGTGYMYEYQLVMNPPGSRDILDDKSLFYKNYKPYFVHQVATLSELTADKTLEEKFLKAPSGKIVLKVVDGKCGVDVEICATESLQSIGLVNYMQAKKFDLAEEFIIQHPLLHELSPSGVNTVRIFTQLTPENQVVLLGCRQRISVNSPVDNMAAGNLAAPIDPETGLVNGPGVYSDITKKDEIKHPITGVDIIGFQVPFWKETIQMVKKAALAHPQNKSIGWDIVITNQGPGFIEGNHDWCKLLWQLPVHQGMKKVLESHLKANE
jgi:hypothetical protein